MFLKYMYNYLHIYNYLHNYVQLFTYVQLSTYVQISSMFWATGGSAQPLQAQGGRALSQPKPHPSDKIV